MRFQYKGCESPRHATKRHNFIVVDDIDTDERKKRSRIKKKDLKRFLEWYFPKYMQPYSINTEKWENRKLGIYIRCGRK